MNHTDLSFIRPTNITDSSIGHSDIQNSKFSLLKYIAKFQSYKKSIVLHNLFSFVIMTIFFKGRGLNILHSTVRLIFNF